MVTFLLALSFLYVSLHFVSRWKYVQLSNSSSGPNNCIFRHYLNVPLHSCFFSSVRTQGLLHKEENEVQVLQKIIFPSE
jgi:hypothetical protein